MFDSEEMALSPAQFIAVKFMEYTVLCSRVAFHWRDETVVLAGWYGGGGKMEMV